MMTEPFVLVNGSGTHKRTYKSGPFTLVIRAIGGPWTPENVMPEIRTEGSAWACCRAIRNPENPCRMSVALDLSGVPAFMGMSGAEKLHGDLYNAEGLAARLKTTLESECPGLIVDIEP